MTTEERLWADYRGTGLTIGRIPWRYRRAEMNALGVTRAADLARIPNGRLVRIAGSVIVRQRPGTAKGFVFLSMEDETGIMNAILDAATFDRFKLVVLGEPFLLIDGVLQNLDGRGLRESRPLPSPKAPRRKCTISGSSSLQPP
jgi:error-prone DNA polymerase